MRVDGVKQENLPFEYRGYNRARPAGRKSAQIPRSKPTQPNAIVNPTIIIQPTIAPVQPRRRTRYIRGKGFFEEDYDPTTRQSLGNENLIRTTEDVKAEGYARYLARERYFAEKEARFAAAGHILKAYNEGGRDETTWRQMERDQRVGADPTLGIDPLRNAPRAVHRANAEYAARMNAFDAYAATGVPRMEQMGTRMEVVSVMNIGQLDPSLGQRRGTFKNTSNYRVTVPSYNLPRTSPGRFPQPSVRIEGMSNDALAQQLAKEKAKYDLLPDDRLWHILPPDISQKDFMYAKGNDGKMYAQKQGAYQVFEQFPPLGPAWVRVTPEAVGKVGLLGRNTELPPAPQPVPDPEAGLPVSPDLVPVPENTDHIVPAPAPQAAPSAPQAVKTFSGKIPGTSAPEQSASVETIGDARKEAFDVLMTQWNIPYADLHDQPNYTYYPNSNIHVWSESASKEGAEASAFHTLNVRPYNGGSFVFFMTEGGIPRGVDINLQGRVMNMHSPNANHFFESFVNASRSLFQERRKKSVPSTQPSNTPDILNGKRDRAVNNIKEGWKIPRDLRTQADYKQYGDIMTWRGYVLSDGKEDYKYRAFKKLEKGGDIYMFYATEEKGVEGVTISPNGSVAVLRPQSNEYFDAFTQEASSLLRGLRERKNNKPASEKKETSPATTDVKTHSDTPTAPPDPKME